MTVTNQVCILSLAATPFSGADWVKGWIGSDATCNAQSRLIKRSSSEQLHFLNRMETTCIRSYPRLLLVVYRSRPIHIADMFLFPSTFIPLLSVSRSLVTCGTVSLISFIHHCDPLIKLDSLHQDQRSFFKPNQGIDSTCLTLPAFCLASICKDQ